MVAVAGTHGKTTTTSLLTVALQHCGADPSFAIGGELNETGSNAHDGSGELFVAEADESDGAFLVYSPYAAMVTNVEADHLDNYGTAEAYRAAFDDFVDRIAPDGFLVVCVDDPGADALGVRRASVAAVVVRVGERADADVRAEDLRFARRRPRRFAVVDRGRRLGEVTPADPRAPLRPRRARRARLRPAARASASPTWPAGSVPSPAPGAGWSSRARSAASASTTATPTTRTRSPATSRPPARWPARAASWSPSSRTWSRAPASSAATMGVALGAADEVVVMDVYVAREDPEPGVTGALVADAVPLAAEHVVFEPSWSAVAGHLVERARPGRPRADPRRRRRHPARARGARAARGTQGVPDVDA